MSTLAIGKFTRLEHITLYIQNHEAYFGFKPHAIELTSEVLQNIADEIDMFSQFRNTADSIANITTHIHITAIMGVTIIEVEE
jgi:hypothetical protein